MSKIYTVSLSSYLRVALTPKASFLKVGIRVGIELAYIINTVAINDVWITAIKKASNIKSPAFLT